LSRYYFNLLVVSRRHAFRLELVPPQQSPDAQFVEAFPHHDEWAASTTEHWNVTEDVTTPALALLRAEWSPAELSLLTLRQLAGLVFLYVKGCASSSSSEARKGLFRDAVGVVPPGADETATQSINCKATRLLDHLLGHPGDTTFDTAPETWQSFADLCATPGLDAWSSPDTSTVFFRDVVPGCEVQRRQKSGLCFMHGSDVVLHYAVARSTGAAGHK
jgi:hypothetical protein